MSGRGHRFGCACAMCDPSKRPPRRVTSATERFWKFVDKSAGPDGCWPWTGALHLGYGKFNDGLSIVGAHRFALELAIGALGKKVFACHRCNNAKCANPAHLYAGTNAQNIQDAVRDGLMRPWGRNIVECRRGHPLNGRNLRVTKTGNRVCLACQSLRYRRKKASV